MIGSCKLYVFIQDVIDCSLPLANFAKSVETQISSLFKDDTTGTVLQIRTRVFQSCGVKRLVGRYRIPNSSEECTVPFFSVFGDFLDFSEDGGETVIFRRSVLPPCSSCSLTTLNMERKRSSEMLAPCTTPDGIMSHHIRISIINAVRNWSVQQSYTFAF